MEICLTPSATYTQHILQFEFMTIQLGTSNSQETIDTFYGETEKKKKKVKTGK